VLYIRLVFRLFLILLIQRLSLRLLLIFIGILSFLLFFFVKDHLLKILLSLEFFILNSVVILGINVIFLNIPTYIIFLFFTLSVCEARIGVRILIGLIRDLGNEILNSL